jgi:hypothetical protein
MVTFFTGIQNFVAQFEDESSFLKIASKMIAMESFHTRCRALHTALLLEHNNNLVDIEMISRKL